MRTFLCTLAILLMLPLLALASPQDEKPAPTRDDEAKAFLEGVKKDLGDQQEASARATSERLLEFWNDEAVTEGVKKELRDAMEEVAGSKDQAAAVVGIGGLAAMGGDDAADVVLKILMKALKAKELPTQVVKTCCETLGTLHSEDGKVVKELTKLLKYKDDEVVGRAASALAGYKDASGKLRKDLFEEVLKTGEGPFAGSQQNDANGRRKWQAIGGGVMAALNALSGQSFADPVAARAWFNEHKKDRETWK